MSYDFFMMFELLDTGERVRLNTTEDQFTIDNGRNYLHPEQVFVIVKEDIRRIFIWKGAKSSVRKRFISSRVAGELQDELIKEAAFHRCKIVSVDQGEEVDEFLDTFRFQSMPVEEKLADMRYIRNIDKQKMHDAGITLEEGPKFVKIEQEPQKKSDEFISPALQELEKKIENKEVVPLPEGSLEKSKKIIESAKKTYHPAQASSISSSHHSSDLSDEKKKIIMDKILKNEVPKGFKRQNLILGHTLYGAVLKKVNVFGKNVEETDWEQVKTVPKETIEIENRKLRIYFDHNNGLVEALEILESTDEVKNNIVKAKEPESETGNAEENIEQMKDSTNFESMTVKDLRNYCIAHKIEVPSNARKADIIKLIEETTKTNFNKETDTTENPMRRKLPEIPRG
jgi:hypothetical protein